jgi:hypothetical protein
MRKRYIDLADSFDYKVICYLLPKLNKKDSVDRRMTNPHGQADRKLWEMVWDKFDKIYEKPTLKEGFSKIVKVKE